jgi:hypothetical protein
LRPRKLTNWRMTMKSAIERVREIFKTNMACSLHLALADEIEAAEKRGYANSQRRSRMPDENAALEQAREIHEGAMDRHMAGGITIRESVIQAIAAEIRAKDAEIAQEALRGLGVVRAENARLQSEVERLRESLKPFAEHGKMFPPEEVSNDAAIWYLPAYDIPGEWATIGDCRRAAEVLGKEEENG